MQRLLMVMTLLAITSSAFAQTNDLTRKGFKCSTNANGSNHCKVSKEVTRKRGNAPGHETAVEPDRYTFPDRASGATGAGGGGGM